MSTIKIDIISDKPQAGKTAVAAVIARALAAEGLEEVVVNCMDGDVEKMVQHTADKPLSKLLDRQPQVVINDVNGADIPFSPPAAFTGKLFDPEVNKA